MIEDLQLVEQAPVRSASTSSPAVRRRARFGPGSLGLLALSAVLQVVSLAQQFSYLFAPKPGELPWLIVVTGAAVLVGVAGVACGVIGATTAAGRRTGALGASLGIAFLVLFAAATSFGWGFLEALSTSV
ncbi:hypothetical protein [Agrococcus sp. Ld7]|uniref:hypothetical protein n=1 Tax=Agrococcus sp. Ld7 TaxID=649148 RepID=UPI00386A9B5D